MNTKTSSNPLSTIVYFASAYCAFQTYQGALSLPAGLLGMTVLGIIGSVIHGYHVESVQKKRDAEALRIFEQVSSKNTHTEIPRYFVYLRPFVTTSKMPVNNRDVGNLPGPEAMLPSSYQSRSFDMEERIADSLVSDGHVVGLGAPGEAVGAGRLPVEEYLWKEAVLDLIAHANHLFIVPGIQEGTLWEITEVLERGHIGKSTFIIPPKPKDENEEFSWDSHFGELTSGFENLGLTIPEFGEEGLIFRYDEAKQLSAKEKVPTASPKDKELSKLVLDIINAKTLPGVV